VVLCAAMQGVPPEEKRSQGPAATREPVATRPRASTQVRSTLVRENMSDHFWGRDGGIGQDCERFALRREAEGLHRSF